MSRGRGSLLGSGGLQLRANEIQSGWGSKDSRFHSLPPVCAALFPTLYPHSFFFLHFYFLPSFYSLLLLSFSFFSLCLSVYPHSKSLHLCPFPLTLTLLISLFSASLHSTFSLFFSFSFSLSTISFPCTLICFLHSPTLSQQTSLNNHHFY